MKKNYYEEPVTYNNNESKSFRQEKAEAKMDIKKQKTKNGMGKFGKTILALAFLGIVAIGVMITWEKINPLQTSTKIDVTILKEKLVGVQEVATAKYTYTDVQIFKNAKKIPLTSVDVPLTTKMFKVKYSGEIKAFFNMKKCKIKDTKSKLIVELPEIKLSQSMDDEIIEEHNNIFNPIHLEEQSDFVKALKLIMKDRSIDKGILKEARSNSKKMIVGLFTPILSNDKTIEVYQSKEALKKDKKMAKDISKKAKQYKKVLHALDEPEQ